MKHAKKNEPYESPAVEVIETQARQVICQSGTTQEYGDESTDDWYN